MQPDGHYIRKAANRDTSTGEKNSFRSNFLLCQIIILSISLPGGE